MAVVYPSFFGAHNWQPMSFNPVTGLAYLPAMDGSKPYVEDKDFKYQPHAFNTAIDLVAISKAVEQIIKSGKPLPKIEGYIRAWDPVAQKVKWQAPMGGSWNSGLLSTAGGLVFGGDAYGMFSAYDATTGTKLWPVDLKTGILAPPMSYMIDGRQYVALLPGWGGPGSLGRLPRPTIAGS